MSITVGFCEMDGFIGVIDYDIAYGGMTVKMVLEML